MPSRFFKHAALVLCTGFVSVGCVTPGGNGTAQGFRDQYLVSRAALESGDYTRAIRGYNRLMDMSGPLQPRIRLELAHTLLRNGDYRQAADEARILAATETGTARSAALAVQGTAEHELALIAMDRGQGETRIRGLLISAQTAMSEVLQNDPDLDPLDALQARLNQISALL